MKVFISHAESDRALARRIARTLQEAGLEVWDGTDVLPGENWAAKAGEALKESEAMVVLLSTDAMQSQNVRQEIGYALGDQAFDNRLITVIATTNDRPAEEDIPWILNQFPVVELSEDDKDDQHLEKIAHLLKTPA